MSKIVIVDDFFTAAECDQAIKLFRHIGTSNPEIIRKNETKVLNIDEINEMNGYKDKLFDAAKYYCEEPISYGWSEIVEWETNSWQDSHVDDVHPNTVFTSISYLNDNYTGGQTFIEDMEVTPKQGRVVLFYGMEYNHGVRLIINGTRYTIPSWYNTLKKPVYIKGIELWK